jgi:hypothetical protein
MAKSNSVTLTSSLIQNVVYVDNSLVITTGEVYTEPGTVTQDGTTWTIEVEADRKGSAEVATSFNNQVGGASHEYAPDGGGTGHTPNELNFYFAVTITFRIGSGSYNTTVYLAQGNKGLSNNWWIGANAVVNVGTPSMVVLNNNTIMQILKLSGGNSSFEFTPA